MYKTSFGKSHAAGQYAFWNDSRLSHIYKTCDGSLCACHLSLNGNSQGYCFHKFLKLILEAFYLFVLPWKAHICNIKTHLIVWLLSLLSSQSRALWITLDRWQNLGLTLNTTEFKLLWFSNITSMYKAFCKDTRHSHSAWEKSTAMSLNIYRTWDELCGELAIPPCCSSLSFSLRNYDWTSGVLATFPLSLHSKAFCFASDKWWVLA